MSADRCPCGERERSQCPGAWEQGCDLGANPAYVERSTLTGAEVDAALATPSADRWVLVPRNLVQACIDHLPYKSAIIPELTAALAAAAPAAPGPQSDLNSSDRARVEWCISAVREIADLGQAKPLGSLYPQAVQVVGALKRVLEPVLNDGMPPPAAAPAAPAAEPVGWISVEKQMPPPDSRCLVWFDGDCIGIAHTFTKWRHRSHPLGYLIQGHGGSHNAVTHWMPLPAAPGAAPAQSREPLTMLTNEQIDAAVYAVCPNFDQWHEGPSLDDIRAIVRAVGITKEITK